MPELNNPGTPGSASRRRFRVTLIVAASALSLVAAELIARAVDGYQLASVRLNVAYARQLPPDAEHRSEPHKWQRDTDAMPYVQQLAVAAGVDRDWFTTPLPPRPPTPVDAELAARTRTYPNIPEMSPNYEWNWKFVTRAGCEAGNREGGEIFNRLNDMFVFDPTDGTDAPTYRFLRNAAYPSGLRTNSYGWRGPDVALNKPANTIRLAFVGASTTVGPHGEPYSYPEIVGVWLNRWARAHHTDVSFDIVNAGREGVNSRSIQAIVRQELTPVEPDLVLYYEGANQFWPADFIWTVLPPKSSLSGPKPSGMASYSAIARRVDAVVRHAVQPGSEPSKPHIFVDWPHDLDEHDPDLTHPHLPIELPHILSDLEVIRREVSEQGGTFVMTSFVWLVHPGLMLDPSRDAFLFDYLNTKYWPFSYAHMRRLLDFQTQAFRKYATVHDLDFIDVAAAYPRDPRLFDDAIHMTHAGIRMQAWIVFNGLVPIVERKLASHEWPRPDRHTLLKHPAFGERHLVSNQEFRDACAAAH
jgi:hypothetical protein